MKKKFKLKFLKHSQEIFDLMMLQDGDLEHINEPKIRIIWHLLAFAFITALIFHLIPNLMLREYLVQSIVLTFYFRLSFIILWILIILLLTLLGYRHYKLMILSGRDLRFKSITFLFVAGVFSYAFLYRQLYVFKPDLYSYLSPVIVPTATSTFLPFADRISLNFDFALYSICVALSMDHPLIASSSIIVTATNSIQLISNILLMVLLIASVVQKKSEDKDKIV